MAECSHSIHKTATQQQANRTRAGRVGNIYQEWDWWEEGVFPWGTGLRQSPPTMSAPQVASPDCLNLSDLLAVVQLSLQADLSVRLDICRQVSQREKLGEERDSFCFPFILSVHSGGVFGGPHCYDLGMRL